MSVPRRILPGATYLISRRCIERRFLLRPDRPVTGIFLYCLAYAAGAFDIVVHGFLVLDNHFHLSITDPSGQLPRFMERLDGLLARALNAFRGRWESFFAPGSYGAVRCESHEDALDKIVYLLTNPVAAGLVSHSRRWTGASSRNWRFGTTRSFERPNTSFFDPNGRLPESVSLSLAAPPGLEPLPEPEADRRLTERLIAAETEIRARFRTEGRTFRGMDQVMRIDPNASPATPEPRRGLNPRIAAKDAATRVEAIEAWREFQAEYRYAWLAWRDGRRDVLFPLGTWLMRVRHRARCSPPPPS